MQLPRRRGEQPHRRLGARRHGDIFFDLANFSVNHEFGERENQRLLATYFGAARSSDLAALILMRFMSDFREAMWGVVQQGISDLDFDFAAYVAEHFERLERTVAEQSFRTALASSKANAGRESA